MLWCNGSTGQNQKDWHRMPWFDKIQPRPSGCLCSRQDEAQTQFVNQWWDFGMDSGHNLFFPWLAIGIHS